MEKAIEEEFRSVKAIIETEETTIVRIIMSATSCFLDKGNFFPSELSFPFLVVNI